jgi:ankyrin repeat protein
MLKKLVALGFCAVSFMACEDVLDPTNCESVRRHFSKQSPPIQMSPDQFVSYVLKTDTANMTLFLACPGVVNINAPNSKGNTAISMAVNKKNLVMVKYLLNHLAEINAKSEQLGLTPLEDAATRADSSNSDIFNMLIEVQKRKDPDLQNIGAAMHLAARYGMLKNVQTLVDGGANPAAKSMEGLTPLHEASKEGRKSVVEYLIEKKVEINPLDRDGYTPYDWAEAMGAGSTFPDVAKILQKAGGKHTAAWRAAM